MRAPRIVASLTAWAVSQRWIRFGVVGCAATLSYYLLGLFFVNFMKMPLLIGNGSAYILSFFVSYAGQSRWTFKARGKDAPMLWRFALAQAAGLALNSLIIEICARLGLVYELSMLLAVVTVPLFVYLVCKIWVFSQREQAGA